MTSRLRLAIQKSGRLHDRSVELLSACGIDIGRKKNQLLSRCRDFPLDILYVRDDDIPGYVLDGVCQLGIVGENVLWESDQNQQVQTLQKLGFGQCRLSLAARRSDKFASVGALHNRRIATSYPVALKRFLDRREIAADIVEVSGAVEITPALGVADAVCDLVSTGGTLAAHDLVELETVYESEAVLCQGPGQLSPDQQEALARLLTRTAGVQRAAKSKYIMMNAPVDAVEAITAVLPGLETPTVIPLPTTPQTQSRVAIHAVAREPVFWETMEALKAAGASGVLVLPIEKIIA